MNIMLIHGQGRSPMAMMVLGWRLRQYRVHYFGYACFYRPLESIIHRFTETLRRKMKGEPYIIVAHSLGGIITRASLPHLTDMLPRHLVMMAPPNQPARLAKRARPNLLYRLTTRDCGQQLGDEAFYKNLPLPTIPTTIVAGTKGINGPFSPFGDEPNDTVLSVEETKLDSPAEMILVHATHAFIMNSPQVARVVLEVVEGCRGDRVAG